MANAAGCNLVSGTCMVQPAPGDVQLRRGSTALAAGRSNAVGIAVAIGNSANKLRERKKMTILEKKQSRMKEIKQKVDVLRGRVADRYRKRRDKGKQPEEDEDVEDSGVDGGAGAAPEVGQQASAWTFKRDFVDRLKKKTTGPVVASEKALAIANTELQGKGGAASAVTLIETAQELFLAYKRVEAAQLLEIARERIDKEQLDRKIDFKVALQLDDRCLWELAKVYESLGRLTLAANNYGILKDRLVDDTEQRRAEAAWATVCGKLADRLFKERRFEESLEVTDTVLELARIGVTGDRFYQDLELSKAMTLHEMGRTTEAKQLLVAFQKKTKSSKRRSQAMFVLDVISAEAPKERNEEFHKIWDQSFKVPENSPGGVRIGSGTSRLQLTDKEREWRKWASGYWEERVKSPLYNAFLILWVTWPFAIPVVSIMRKMDM